jgi:hypothetical protein
MNKEFQKAIEAAKTAQEIREALRILPLPKDLSNENLPTLEDLLSELRAEEITNPD